MADNAPLYKGYRVYPRGFLGASLGEQLKAPERPHSSALKSHTYHPDWFKNPNPPREVNRNIESMWRKMNEVHVAIDDMEFREQLLKVALDAFGTRSFQEWVSIQHSGPSTGDLHMEFIKDTMQFIMTGRRNMNLNTWTMMLSMKEITHNETPNDGQFSWFFRDDTAIGQYRGRNQSLIDVIQRWCAQPGGFADLAQSLHVMFGAVPN